MKEIKFRAWDKKTNTYHAKIWNLGWRIGGIRFFWDDYKNSDGETMVTDLIDGDYVLMQYTGLKDKNGQEIYEGDIIKFDVYDGYSSERATDSVYYHVKEARFRLATMSEYDVWRFGEDIEVIGNIYETPELLKDSHESQASLNTVRRNR